MSRFVRPAIQWLVGIGLLIVGERHTPDRTGPWSMIPWAWLDANWIALTCFVLAALLFSYTPLKWWIDRQSAKDVRRRIRTELEPGSYPETDIIEVLRYLHRESAWGWRQYARLNFWEMVDGEHLKEFARAARDGHVLVFGFGTQEGKVIRMERRLWKALAIDPSTFDARVPGAAPYLHKPVYTELSIATVELKIVWPPASLPLRVWARSWVWLKTAWYGTSLSNWLDKRRHPKRENEVG